MFGLTFLLLILVIVLYVKLRNITSERTKDLPGLRKEKSEIVLDEGFEQLDNSTLQSQSNEDNASLLHETEKNQNECNVNQLRTSIVDGDIQTFLYSIQNFEKTSLEKVDLRGFNCLHLAAKGGNLSIFKRILHLGVSIEKTTNDGQNSNVLHIAAHHGCLPICNHVLNNHKWLFSQKDNSGMNPAHYAALAGQYHILELMLKQNCNFFDNTERYVENIVHLACMRGSLEVCEFVNSNQKISSLLHAKNCEGWNSIQCATKNGHLEIVEFLFENTVDVKNKSTKTGKNCLHTACKTGYYQICKYLLGKDPTLLAEVDIHGQHAGYHAVKNGHIDILELLIKTNKSELRKTTPDKINILHVACKYAWYNECVIISKEFPYMVHEITEKGWNAALFVAEKPDKEDERIKILTYLVSKKLNVCHESRSGKTILVNARNNNLNNIVKYLTENFEKLKSIKRSIRLETYATYEK